MSKTKMGLFLLAVSAILVISCILTRDRGTWILEVFPVFIGVPILVLTFSRFPFTRLVYFFLVIHVLILAVGGIYTYAEVPLGFWMQDLFGFTRNHYDRIGHFAQGFIPALLIREILIRTSPLRPGKWLGFLVVTVCLSISAFYEFVEWWVTIYKGSSAEAFLGTQGDVWDAHWDMLFATIGATLSILLMSKLHNRFIRNDIGIEV